MMIRWWRKIRQASYPARHILALVPFSAPKYILESWQDWKHARRIEKIGENHWDYVAK